MPREAGLDFNFLENGKSFLENAYGKALALYERAGVPVIADDSGLCVTALGGEPGLYSSRYGSSGGALLDTPKRNEFLLSRLKGERSAGPILSAALCLSSAPTDSSLRRKRYMV